MIGDLLTENEKLEEEIEILKGRIVKLNVENEKLEEEVEALKNEIQKLIMDKVDIRKSYKEKAVFLGQSV